MENGKMEENQQKKTLYKPFSTTLLVFTIVLITLFSCSLASAWEFDNVKEFEKGELEYGKITIYNAFNFPLIGSKLAEYTLIDNTDQCLINCYAEGTAKIYSVNRLFSDLNFYNRERQLRSLKESKILIQKNVSYEVDVPEYYEVCEYVEENQTDNCYQDILGSHKETRYRTFWEEYKGEDLEEGEYHWRIEAKKNPRESIDWIGSAFGESFTEWAWWNSDWDEKREIKVQENSGNAFINYSVLLNVTYSSNMSNNFSDLRFVNSTENGEISYWIKNKVDGSFADVWVKVPSLTASVNTSIYMYYNNSAATVTTGNENNTFLLYDAFTGANTTVPDTNKWNKYSTPTILSNKMRFIDENIYSVNSFNVSEGIIIEAEAFFIVNDFTSWPGIYNCSITTEFPPDVTCTYGYNFRAGGTVLKIYNWTAGAPVQIGSSVSVGAAGYDTRLTVDPSNNNVSFWYNNGTGDYAHIVSDIYAWPTVVWLYVGSDGTAASTTNDADNLVVRRWANPEPTYYIGEAQSKDVPPIVTLNTPIDNANLSSQSVIFNCTVNDPESLLINATLFGNWTGSWIANETNSSGLNADYIFTKTISAGDNYLWNCYACDDTDQCSWGGANRTFNIDIVYPTINLTSPPLIIDYHVLNENLSLNWTVVDEHLDSCWFDYNNTNTTVTCGDNHTEFTATTQTNLTFYANDTAGNLNSSFREWSYKVLENVRTYNATSYETAQEVFELNISSNGSETVTANLHYDGVSYSTTKTGNDYEMFFTTTLDVPEGAGNNLFYWQVHYGAEDINTNSNNQTISTISFDYCTTGNVYVNFTFKNEDDDSDLNATIDASTWNYWLGSGTVKKSLLYSNSTENPSYKFCFSQSNRTLNVDTSVQYSSTGFPQRKWDNATTLTNTTTDIVLYLLSSTDGIYTTFQVLSSADQPIKGVYATARRAINGNIILVGAGTTGDDGGVTFWVNPDYSHTFLFAKAGYDDVSLTITPTQSTYTVYMGGAEFNESYDFNRGISYSIAPELYELINDTYYVFNFTISSSYWDLTDYGFTLFGQNGTSLGSNSGSTGSGSSVTLNVSTLNYTWIKMDYYWNINGNYSNGSRTWGVEQDDYGYGFKTFFAHLKNYTEQEIFGLNEWSRTLIIFILIFIFIGSMSYASGLYSPATISVELFALVAFFDVATGLLPSPAGAVAHFPTIITGLVMIVLLIREALR